jgi:hypothetical protein
MAYRTNNKFTKMLLSDFALDALIQCGKMVMGYEKENHVREGHGGQGVEWMRLK